MDNRTNFNVNKNIPKEDQHKFYRGRPKFLLVLVVLSSIHILFGIFGSSVNLMHGPISEELLEGQYQPLKETIKNIESQAATPQSVAKIKGMIHKTIHNSQYKNTQVFYSFNWLTLLGFIIGAVSIFAMYNLKKIGFHLYILYSLSPIITAYLLIPGNLILSYFIIYTVVLSAIFAILYGLNLKYLK